MILVTGGTGFIGRHLVHRLLSQGKPVRCLVRRSSALGELPAGVEGVEANLENGSGVEEALCGVDTIVHLAGVTKARLPGEYERGNAAATASLAAAASGVRRLVHVSSLAAAGPSAPGKALTEQDPPHPVSLYGRSKLRGEQNVQKSPVGERAVIVRPPVVYGPGDRDVYQMIRAVAAGWMVVIGAEPQYFSLIYVGDLIDGLMAAADREDAAGRVLYVAHPKPVSWADFGNAAARLMRRKVRTVAVPAKAAYALGWCAERWTGFTGKPGILSRDKVNEACCAGWVCDPSLAQQVLDFQAKTDLEEGLRQTLDWYKEAGWLKF